MENLKEGFIYKMKGKHSSLPEDFEYIILEDKGRGVFLCKILQGYTSKAGFTPEEDGTFTMRIDCEIHRNSIISEPKYEIY